jgi:hypothetical protein
MDVAEIARSLPEFLHQRKRSSCDRHKKQNEDGYFSDHALSFLLVCAPVERSLKAERPAIAAYPPTERRDR